jgi:hypothetical protein
MTLPFELNTKLVTIEDSFLRGLKNEWFQGKHRLVTNAEFIPAAEEWFKSTKINDIQGWDKFPFKDVIMGCTHYIESFFIKYGIDGFQILDNEYAYYRLMGKHGVPLGQLDPGKPLVVSFPNFKYIDDRPGWRNLFKECEEKNIDIHLDMAWITTARDVAIDLGHPNIKSFAMSLSKYALQWNRVGIRWTKQRTMDSVAIFNHYYGDINSGITSCGNFMVENIPRDYGWVIYGDKHNNLCEEHGLISTKMIHVVKKPNDPESYGIAKMLII